MADHTDEQSTTTTDEPGQITVSVWAVRSLFWATSITAYGLGVLSVLVLGLGR